MNYLLEIGCCHDQCLNVCIHTVEYMYYAFLPCKLVCYLFINRTTYSHYI